MDPVGPVFVVGCPRSGTSALSWAIAAHPVYWTSVETHFFYHLLRDGWLNNAWSDSRGPNAWIDRYAVDEDEFLACAGIGFDRMIRARANGCQWVDGSPENLMVASTLLRMFGQSQIFQVIRNPGAVCHSMFTSGFTEPWACDIAESIRTWKHYAASALALTVAFPDRVTWIRQEDMRAAPSVVADIIGRRLGLEDTAPITSFLMGNTINSSANKQSYVEESPFQGNVLVNLDPAMFQDLYGDRIRKETAALAAQCGYGWA